MKDEKSSSPKPQDTTAAVSTGESPKCLNDLKTGVDYLCPKHYLPGGLSDHTGKLEFLKACERLKIPPEKWPPWGHMLLPGWPAQLSGSTSEAPKTVGLAVRPLVFGLPAFDLCDDDHRSWRRKADQAWREFRTSQFGPYLKECTGARRVAESIGLLAPRRKMRFDGKKRDDSIPLELRYEFAARRYLLAETWAGLVKLSNGACKLDTIRKTVTTILSELGLTPRKST